MYSTKRVRSYKDRKAIAGRRVRRIVGIIFLFLLYQFFSIYVSTPMKIESRSMEPLLTPSDRILFSRVSLQTQTMFERGDLVVIQPPFYRENQGFINMMNPFLRFFTFQKIQMSSYNRPEWEIPYMVKRIVALPGDSIRIEEFKALITQGDKREEVHEYDLISGDYTLNDPYLPEGWKINYLLDGNMEEIRLGEGEFFILSDSRGMGNDSLIWGALKEEYIIGKAFFRYFPFSRMSPL